MFFHQHRWAIGAGVLGATASCLAKIALSQHQLEDFACSNYDLQFDDMVLHYTYQFLGDLMIRHRINFMPYMLRIQRSVEDTAVRLGVFEVDWCRFLLLGPRLGLMILVLLLNTYTYGLLTELPPGSSF